jgi:hypothetical protein
MSPAPCRVINGELKFIAFLLESLLICALFVVSLVELKLRSDDSKQRWDILFLGFYLW